MIRLVTYALVAAALGGLIVYLLADGLPEGAVMGGILGGSVGALIAARRRYGGSAPSYELEAAGIHDDNLITIARGNLAREAYRNHFQAEDLTDADQAERRKRVASADGGR